MVYASSFIVLHSKGSSLQNRIRTFSQMVQERRMANSVDNTSKPL